MSVPLPAAPISPWRIFRHPDEKCSSASTQIRETAPKAFFHLVKLDGVHTSKAYPGLLRRIHDAETGSKLTFPTKLLDAPNICEAFALACGIVFQEATSSDQAFLRTLRKRGENTNPDRGLSLCSDHAKKAENWISQPIQASRARRLRTGEEKLIKASSRQRAADFRQRAQMSQTLKASLVMARRQPHAAWEPPKILPNQRQEVQAYPMI